MATRAEQIRRKQMADEAKRRLTSGDSFKQSPMINPRTEAVRNYTPPVGVEPMGQLMNKYGDISPAKMIQSRIDPLPDKPISFGPTYKMADSMKKFGSIKPTDSTLFQAVDGNKAAQSAYEGATGTKFNPMTQYDINKEAIDKLNPLNPVKYYSGAMNWLTQGNPAGQFVSRAGSMPDNIMSGGNPVTVRPDLGPVANKAADIIGAGLTMAAPTGAPIGMGPISAPYKAMDKVVAASPKIQGLERAATNTLSSATRLSPKASQRAVQGVTREIGGGAIQGPAMALTQGQPTNEDLLESALIGSVTGAALAGAGSLAGSTLKSAMNNRRVGNALMKGIRNTELPVHPVGAPKTLPEPVEPLKQSWFSDLFGDQGVGISAFSSSKSSGKMLNTQDQIVNSPIKNDIRGAMDGAAAQARAAYQNFVDYLSPLKKFGDDTYNSAMDASRANNIANTIARDAFVTPEGQVVGESLQGVFKKVPRGRDGDFVDYITLRHAETRMARGERVYDESLNMSPEKVRSRIEMFEKRFPGFQGLAKEWDKFNDNVLNHLGVQEGLISEELYQALREKNPYYAPMRRQFSKSEKPGRNFIAKQTSSSFSGQKAPIKEVSPTGSVRKIVDPRKTTIESISAWTNAAMRNRTMQSLVDAVKRDPERFNGIAEIVQGPNDKRNLRDILLNDGMDDFVEALDGDFKSLFKTTKLDGDNIVRAMVDGQPVYLQVHDPEVVKTLIGMGPKASNIIIDLAGALSNATKRGATGVLAPMFAVKGATMDLVQSAIQSKNPAQQMVYTVYGILSGIADRLNIPVLRNMAQEFRRAGGEYSAVLKGERNVNRRISNMTREPILSPKGIAKTTGKLAAFPFKTLEAVGDIAENAPRMAAYKLEMKRLGNVNSPENVRKAMEQAREITVNFSRRGALTRDIEALVPYNNAAVQGTFRILKAFKENPVRTITAIAALSVLPKMYEYTQFGDDPDYQQLPARERYRFLIISKNEDGSFDKIPMEPAYNSFGELTIEALRAFKDGDPNAFKGMADALANAWLPPAVTGALQGATQGGGVEQSFAGAINSTVMAPIAAVGFNQSFTGAPIVPQGLSDRSRYLQYDERTSSIAKQIGKHLKMAPMKVDYLIRAYGGDPARLLLPLTSDAGAGNARNTMLKNFIVDPQVSNTLTDDFYTARENLSKAYTDYQEAGAELPSWYDDNLRKMVTSSANGSISRQLSAIRTEIKEVGADKSLSNTEKTNKLRDLRQQMNTIYIDVNQQLEEAGVPLK